MSGALILRRRGVYFSLLTLALTALLFAIALSLDRISPAAKAGSAASRARPCSASISNTIGHITGWSRRSALRSAFLLWRFHRSPVGSVLVAIRENEQRARFVGYPTNRYKLIGFVLSAAIVALAGVLSVFNHRFASAEPLAVAFSGELIAMVVIGGMRSFLGPALGALFFILFREFLSIWTPHWLFYFGLLFVGFIMFSPIRPRRRRRAVDRAVPQACRARRRQWRGACYWSGATLPQTFRRPPANGRAGAGRHATSLSISAEFMRSTG